MNDFIGSGLGPSQVGNQISGSLVAFPLDTYATPQLDLTQVVTGIELVPAKPGHIPVSATARFLIESTTGTQTTPLVSQAGSDAAHTNFKASTSAPANVDVTGAPVPAISSAVGGSAVTTQRIPNATVFFDITAGAQGTGGFTLRGKFVVVVRWQAVG